MNSKMITTCLLSLLVAGCATPGSQNRTGESGASLGDSSVDISYVLGHSRRRFVAWSRGDNYGGQTLLDHQILRESGIDRTRYSEFLTKVEQFVNSPRRKPAELEAATPATVHGQGQVQLEDESCRTPFTVTVQTGANTKSIAGCRGADDGTLSRLVRDGEFLLYSTQ